MRVSFAILSEKTKRPDRPHGVRLSLQDVLIIVNDHGIARIIPWKLKKLIQLLQTNRAIIRCITILLKHEIIQFTTRFKYHLSQHKDRIVLRRRGPHRDVEMTEQEIQKGLDTRAFHNIVIVVHLVHLERFGTRLKLGHFRRILFQGRNFHRRNQRLVQVEKNIPQIRRNHVLVTPIVRFDDPTPTAQTRRGNARTRREYSSFSAHFL